MGPGEGGVDEPVLAPEWREVRGEAVVAQAVELAEGSATHPLFVFNLLGDLERCAARSSNVHSAVGWGEVLKPLLACYRGTVRRHYFPGDRASMFQETRSPIARLRAPPAPA